MNIGSRELFAEDISVKYSAKDYVQNGLIAMWDGIENAGYGQHDYSATTWKDLIGSHDFVLPAGISFGDDCAIFTKSAGKDQTWAFANSEISTIEVCGKFTGTSVGFAFQFGYNASSAFRIFAYLSTNNRGFQFASGGQTMNCQATGARWSVAGVWDNPSQQSQSRTYYNGASSPMNTGTTGWGANKACIGYYNTDTWAYVGEICCVRLYSRALASDEILKNANVD